MRPACIVLIASSIALATAYTSHSESLHAGNAGIVDERDLEFDDGLRHTMIARYQEENLVAADADEGLAERQLKVSHTIYSA